MMAQNHRDQLKKKIAQSLNNSAKAIVQLDEVRQEFEGVHQLEADMLTDAAIRIATGRERLLQFVAKAWVLDEEGIMKYMA